MKTWTMSYFQHLWANWKVALRSLVMFFFHFLHGILPFECTSHERWEKAVKDLCAVKKETEGDQ